ncbi:Uncharacterised protein [Klebsiella pneumoniae]|nr:Uncharacterised protein [Klebsiella pneumoniae]
MYAVKPSGWAVGTFDKPGKGFIPFFIAVILFRAIENHFLTSKTFQSLSYILAGFSGGQPECFSVFSNMNFADTVVFLQ